MMNKALLLGLLILVFAFPVTGDWLITRDGAKVETKGPWQVKGERVIFTLPNGTLSALRKSEVDLEASAAVTENKKVGQSKAGQSEQPPARRPSVLVLNNKNIGPANQGAPDEETTAEKPKKKPKIPGAAQVELQAWNSRESKSVDGIEVVGTVKNTGVDIATNITVTVTVVDEEGNPLLDTTAFLRSSGLAPGKSTTFRALLPGVFTLFADPVIDVQAGGVTIGGVAPADAEKDTVGDAAADDDTEFVTEQRSP